MQQCALTPKKLSLFGSQSVIVAVAVFAVGLEGALFADTLSLTTAGDTYISEHFEGPNGTNFDMVIGTQGFLSGMAMNRGLIRFDVSSIPTNAVVNSVGLQVAVTRSPTGAGANTFELHRLLRAWDEAQSTWTLRFPPDHNWDSPGGASGSDYSGTTSGSVPVGLPETYTFSSTPEMIADVTMWIRDASANQGWLVRTADESISPSARRFASRESASGPQLTIDYTAPQPLRIDSAGINNGEFCLRFNGKAGKSYIVERRQHLESGSWSQVTTVPPRSDDGPVTVCDPMNAATSFYRVAEF